jgi:NitT/TauT family transport system permease protein
MPKIKLSTIVTTAFWIATLLFWQILSNIGLINQAFVPAPLSILQEFLQPELYALFLVDAGFSISRMVLGLLIAYILVMGGIYLVVQFDIFDEPINQLRSVIKFVPPPVLIPLAILGVGINNMTVVTVVIVAGAFLMLDYAFIIMNKELANYSGVFESWNTSNFVKFRHFFVPISHYLSYRFISTLIIWALSITIFSEIVTGVSEGFGPRLIQLQQLYQSSTLFALIIGIVALSFACERLLVHSLSRYKFDAIRNISLSVLSIVIVCSIVFQGLVSWTDFQDSQSKFIISTYSATLNLPVFVYAEKFDTLDINLQTTSSGIQTIDNVIADRAAVGGYADLPNVLSALNQNDSIRVISQAEERQDDPLLYLVSRPDVRKGEYENLSGVKIGYFPNNPLIETGLDLTLLIGGASTGGNEYISGNDPVILSQSFTSNQLDALLTIEPYVTQVENQSDLVRINTNESLIDGLAFESLPLAGLVVNPDKFTEEELQTFQAGMNDAIDYIQNNSTDGIANTELGDIMEKYNIDRNSRIPPFTIGSSIEPENLDQIINLIIQYDRNIGQQIADIDSQNVYLITQ